MVCSDIHIIYLFSQYIIMLVYDCVEPDSKSSFLEGSLSYHTHIASSYYEIKSSKQFKQFTLSLVFLLTLQPGSTRNLLCYFRVSWVAPGGGHGNMSSMRSSVFHYSLEYDSTKSVISITLSKSVILNQTGPN